MAADMRRRIRRRAFAQALDFHRKERTEGSKLRTILYYEVNNTDSKLITLRREKSKLESKLQTLKKVMAQRTTSQAIEQKTLPARGKVSSKNKSSVGNVYTNKDKKKVVNELQQSSSRHISFNNDSTNIVGEMIKLTQKIEEKSREGVYITSPTILSQTTPRNLTLTNVLELLPEIDREKALESQRGSSPDPFNFNHHVCLGLARLNLEEAMNKSNTFLFQLDHPTAKSLKNLHVCKDVTVNDVKEEQNNRSSELNGSFDTSGLKDVEWNDLVGQKSNQKALLNKTEISEDAEKALVEKNFDAMLREAKRARYVRQSESTTN